MASPLSTVCCLLWKECSNLRGFRDTVSYEYWLEHHGSSDAHLVKAAVVRGSQSQGMSEQAEAESADSMLAQCKTLNPRGLASLVPRQLALFIA